MSVTLRVAHCAHPTLVGGSGSYGGSYGGSINRAGGHMLQIKGSPRPGNVHAAVPAASRLLTTTKGDVTNARIAIAASSTNPPRPVQPIGTSRPAANSKGNKLKEATKPRRLATSARILPDGFVKPALYDENTPIPRCESYPTSYHMVLFPWLLSAERQRTPMQDLNSSVVNSTSEQSVDKNSRCADASQPGLLGLVVQMLPMPMRRSLAHSLNLRIAQQALGMRALDEVCEGAAMALPSIARLLSSVSDESTPEATAELLAHMFSAPLLARFTSDLARLRRDDVQLALDVRRVNSARVHQIRTQTGPPEAFAALSSLMQPHPPQTPAASLRMGLVRQSYRFSSMLGATHAAPVSDDASRSSVSREHAARDSLLSSSLPLSSWTRGMWAALTGQANVRVRVDVELNVDMRYRLIGLHSGPSGYDQYNGTTKVIVDDDATRNLMLTLESTPIESAPTSDGSGSGASMQQAFEWRVADVDYLLSSERRIKQELEEARSI
ncbi:hypothetical protein GGI07_004913 [Coemansia sp. Benny D115]|nr:hypothetical protein GGI07_004913 [Coemansia sp. Benny D115]